MPIPFRSRSLKQSCSAVAAALVLSCCGGDTGPTCMPATSVRIQLFGDSTQFGQRAFTLQLSPENPMAGLQRAMDARFGAGRVTVEQRAVNGSNSGGLLNGTDGRNPPWPGGVAADIVLVNHAINDASEALPLAVFRERYERFTVAPAPARVVFQTPVPSHGRSFDVAPYAAVQREVAAARQLAVADVHAWFLRQPEWQSLIPDGVHPGDAGYAGMVSGAVVPVVLPMVARLLCQAP